ncbi:hypothetical protein LUZ60_008945 [Juncus effusus]|nr:hypothetical protein LUZ60_008945 [Juncus effusus]
MEPPEQQQQQQQEESEEEDMDFIPFLREDIPSDDNSSGFTSETSSPASAPPQTLIPHSSPPNPNPNPTREEGTGPTGEEEDEEAICRRTRARVSLEKYSLDELEAFLQGSDDDCDGQNVDEEEEYRRFLAAVLSDDLPYTADEPGPADEDENDADFDAELEEALESDPDESEQPLSQNQNLSSSFNPKKCRPETRQKNNNKNNNSRNNIVVVSPSKSCLRPILPVETLQPSQQNLNLNLSSNVKLGFSEGQLAELNKIVREHVQLLVQVFSISVLDPARQTVASETQGLIKELIFKREEFNGNCGYNGNILSVLDVEPLRLAKGFLDDVTATVLKYRQCQLSSSPDKSFAKKEPLFPLPAITDNQIQSQSQPDASEESNNNNNNNTAKPPRKSMAAMLVEKTRRQTAALVPADVARLVGRFIGVFEEELVPRKPPPPSVANRVLFTDAEDGLLALGFFEYNNDWDAIQKRYLPCKSKHQIFVRAKNQRASKAPENPIKAVRRFKNSALTSEEKLRIHEALKVFKNDWHSVWKFVVPYRDPALLPRQWQIALGTKKNNHKKQKTEKEKSRNRIYEANRRHNKRISQLNEEDNEKDGEATNADKETENINTNTNNYNNNNNNNNNYEEEAYVHEAFLSDNNPITPSISNPQTNSTIPAPYSKLPFLSLERRNRGQRVVKLAPDLPAVNLPKSVRVISRSALNLTPNPRFQNPGFKNPPKPLNLFPNCKNRETDSRSDSDFQMHPLLFQSVPDREFVYRSVEQRSDLNGTTSFGRFCEEVPESSRTVDFHPLLQRNEESQKIDLNIQLYSSVLGNNAGMEGVDANVAQLEKEIINEESSVQGIVMEQEELSDSEEEEEETENVEFEREEMEDSDSDHDFASESAHHFINHHHNNTDLRNIEALTERNQLSQDSNQVKSRGSKENSKKGDNSVNKNDLKSRKSRAKNTKLDKLDPSSSNKPRKPRK